MPFTTSGLPRAVSDTITNTGSHLATLGEEISKRLEGHPPLGGGQKQVVDNFGFLLRLEKAGWRFIRRIQKRISVFGSRLFLSKWKKRVVPAKGKGLWNAFIIETFADTQTPLLY